METQRAGAKPRPWARLGALALLLAACRTAGTETRPAWQLALEQRNRELEREFAAGNLLGVADIYADDAVLVDARGQRVRGRDALDAHWSLIEEPLAWRLEIRALRGSEALAYELGRSHLSTRREGAVHTSVSDFLLVWRHDPDGLWRIEYDASWPVEER
jgi:uncharacterized protein (TIGR02246 family)